MTMFSAVHNAAIGAATLAFTAGVSLQAQAAYTVTLLQQGTDVIATGSGSLDLTDLTSLGPDLDNPRVFGPKATIIVGPAGPTILSAYSGLSGPGSFGPGFNHDADSGTGNVVGLLGLGGILGVPTTYTSSTPLGTSTATWSSATFASLQVTPGTYEWTWGTGADADTFTLQIGPAAAVPEPASLALFGIGLAGLGMVLRTRPHCSDGTSQHGGRRARRRLPS
jgi:hypothetical protein